jgi:hypothetical protein
MRIRATKPEFWRSETIASLEWEHRFVLKGIESYVDDNGVGKDSPVLFAADVFPHDLAANGSETLARLSRAFLKLAEANLIVRYEVNGEALLYVNRWKRLQRIDKPGKGRYPRPDGTFDYEDDCVIESVASPRETVAPVTGEQGNRGTGEKKTSSPRGDGAFAEFYMAYPRKVGKDAARKAFESAVRRADVTAVLEGVRRFASDPNLPEKKFIPHPATWLNRGGWGDEPLPGPDGSTPKPTGPVLTPQEQRQQVWLSARGIAWEEYLERKDEPGWLDSVKRMEVRHG